MHRMTLRVEEAAKLLGIGRCAAYLAVERGEIPSIRIGDYTLIPRAELVKMLPWGTDMESSKRLGEAGTGLE